MKERKEEKKKTNYKKNNEQIYAFTSKRKVELLIGLHCDDVAPLKKLHTFIENLPTSLNY